MKWATCELCGGQRCAEVTWPDGSKGVPRVSLYCGCTSLEAVFSDKVMAAIGELYATVPYEALKRNIAQSLSNIDSGNYDGPLPKLSLLRHDQRKVTANFITKYEGDRIRILSGPKVDLFGIELDKRIFRSNDQFGVQVDEYKSQRSAAADYLEKMMGMAMTPPNAFAGMDPAAGATTPRPKTATEAQEIMKAMQGVADMKALEMEGLQRERESNLRRALEVLNRLKEQQQQQQPAVEAKPEPDYSGPKKRKITIL